MKQLLILSGKGGTGKTTVAGSFIKLLKAKAFADCDVDAPNLQLILNTNSEPESKNYFGLPKAFLNESLCVNCGLCKNHCRFDAIKYDNGHKIDFFACEGCGVCEAVCPADAIELKPAVAGELMLYKKDGNVFSTAKLKMGSGTSGKLVSEVKKRLTDAVPATELGIIDGSPGIGCPVIASLSGADIALIVTEPSLSGISDMERIIKTARYFGTKTAVCVNKYDTNMLNTEKIEKFCVENNLPYLGKIPYDNNAVKAINSGKCIVDIDCASGEAVREIFKNLIELMQKEKIL